MFPCGVAVHRKKLFLGAGASPGKLRHADQRFEGEKKSLQWVCLLQLCHNRTPVFLAHRCKRGWLIKGRDPIPKGPPTIFSMNPALLVWDNTAPDQQFRQVVATHLSNARFRTTYWRVARMRLDLRSDLFPKAGDVLEKSMWKLSKRGVLSSVTLPETNMAHENPPFWLGKIGIFHGLC